MTRYHVATAGECEAVRQAINAGWRAGPAAFAYHVRGGEVFAEPIAQWEARTGAFVPGRTVGSSGPLGPERLIVSGSDAVLELPDEGLNGQLVLEQLGKGIVPRANQLATVTRAREHAQFATGIRDALDDRYVDATYKQNTDLLGVIDTVTANAAITVELQNGLRATGAIARKVTRGNAQAIERALGGGRG